MQEENKSEEENGLFYGPWLCLPSGQFNNHCLNMQKTAKMYSFPLMKRRIQETKIICR
ncbi:hypothetical protein GCM10007968_14820 [Sporolactobacillus putidus]|uniref:Uncharacterized protein n=1 Tax=Sporolactobacillus putidus TaxID=492735 RepID=A0A917S1X3_9BACL|nr:hypothetical protein GCM10007968_14820 [Sporolactobacillus putidus]